MTMPIVIREAQFGDAATLFDLVRQFSVSFVPVRSRFEHSFARLLAERDAWIGVAEIDGETVGYCLGFDRDTFYANGPIAYVEEIMVLAEFRQRGVGTQLAVSELRGAAEQCASSATAIARALAAGACTDERVRTARQAARCTTGCARHTAG
jgi:GNAT superfamily N-acetyltransferase